MEGEEGRASFVPQTHQTVAVHSPPTWPGQAGRPGVSDPDRVSLSHRCTRYRRSTVAPGNPPSTC